MGKKQTKDNKIKSELLEGNSPFKNRILISMPSLEFDIFNKTIIYICAHSDAGAMGIVLNQKFKEMNFFDLFKQLDLPETELKVEPNVHFGGPVEVGRGFVLHSTDFICDDTVKVDTNLGVTGTTDILKAIATGEGPNKSIFALGYAGWGPEQLEQEIYNNNWLIIDADDDLIFDTDLHNKWEKALESIGVNPSTLSSLAGHS